MRRVIVTRPASEAVRWTQALQARGWTVLALPLIDIVAPTDRSSLDRARAAWQTYDAVMFVSAAAVEHFFAGVAAVGDVHHTRCWAPGPGTARALQAAGVAAERIDAPDVAAAQFDSEALWQVVARQVGPGHRLLVVRGDNADAMSLGHAVSHEPASRPGQGREWLAQQSEHAGGTVAWCVAYTRRRPVWSDEQRALARTAAVDGSIWLFSSSEAIANLQVLLPDQDWRAASAIVTHPRIAEAARRLGLGSIHMSRPALPDVVRGLESLI